MAVSRILLPGNMHKIMAWSLKNAIPIRAKIQLAVRRNALGNMFPDIVTSVAITALATKSLWSSLLSSRDRSLFHLKCILTLCTTLAAYIAVPTMVYLRSLTLLRYVSRVVYGKRYTNDLFCFSLQTMQYSWLVMEPIWKLRRNIGSLRIAGEQNGVKTATLGSVEVDNCK